MTQDSHFSDEPEIYQFLDLERAFDIFNSINAAAAQLKQLVQSSDAHQTFCGFTGLFFPLFTDGATSAIAVDLNPGKRNRVVVVEFESPEPVREVYNSFEAFIEDAIRVNEDGGHLSALETS